MENKRKPGILVVENETSLARYLQLELEHEGYRAEIAQNGYEAMSRLIKGKYNLVLLDVMLPGLDGFEVVSRIRKYYDVPVIMLTDRDDTQDKIKGLDTGADDYVRKTIA